MMKARKRCAALLLALLAFFVSAAAQALDAEPKAGSEVAPGDGIVYTYTLAEDMENGVLRVALGSGLTLKDGSVKVGSKHEPEIVYGSDGFVIMAEELNKGDTLTFIAEAGSTALEIWARVTSSEGDISEEDGYAAHILALPPPSQDASTASQGLEEQEARPRMNTAGLIALASLLVLAVAGLAFHKRIYALLKAMKAPATGGGQEPAAVQPADNTVEYLVIPEAEAGDGEEPKIEIEANVEAE